MLEVLSPSSPLSTTKALAAAQSVSQRGPLLVQSTHIGGHKMEQVLNTDTILTTHPILQIRTLRLRELK